MGWLRRTPKMTPREVDRSHVLVGREGWLFWAGRKRGVLDYYRPRLRNALRVRRWARLFSERERRCRELGGRFIQVIAPDKLSIYPDKIEGHVIHGERGFAGTLARRSPCVLDLVGPLTRARTDGETLLKTDTHWTHAGYLTAYRTLCAAMGVEPASHILGAAVAEPTPCVFDLGGKFDPPIVEMMGEVRLERRAERVEANVLLRHQEALELSGFVPGMMVGSRAVFRNGSPGVDPRTLVVFGDSYVFHRTGLGAMLAESFAETHLIWSAAMDWTYLERLRPDLVLNETAERFARTRPKDGIDVDALAAQRVREAEAKIAAA